MSYLVGRWEAEGREKKMIGTRSSLRRDKITKMKFEFDVGAVVVGSE